MITTHTRTHVTITFANPYMTCDQSGEWVTGYHDHERCGCDSGDWLVPCEHDAAVGTSSVCPSWSPVDGSSCLEHLGRVDHAEPTKVGDR